MARVGVDCSHTPKHTNAPAILPALLFFLSDMEKLNQVYALYDSRYNTDPNKAILYGVCDTLEKAIEEKQLDFPDAVVVLEKIEWTANNQCRTISSQIIQL